MLGGTAAGGSAQLRMKVACPSCRTGESQRSSVNEASGVCCRTIGVLYSNGLAFPFRPPMGSGRSTAGLPRRGSSIEQLHIVQSRDPFKGSRYVTDAQKPINSPVTRQSTQS